MSEENGKIYVAPNDSSISPDSGSITPLEQDEKITIKRATNHNEISIMESNWEQIKRKVQAISLRKGVDPIPVLVGAAIPYALTIIGDYIRKSDPDYFPFFICVLLIVLCKFLAPKLPFLGEDNLQVNKVHLSDLFHLIKQIDRNQDSNSK